MNNFVTKYKTFNESTDLGSILKEDWIMFRKYNGIQGVWDGGKTRGLPLSEIHFVSPEDKKNNPTLVSTGLWSIGRDGYPHILRAPKFWINHLIEGVPLCGELWYKDNWTKVMSIVMKKNPSYSDRIAWKQIKFIPFNIKPYKLWGYYKIHPKINTPDYFYNLEYKNVIDLLKVYCSGNDIMRMPLNDDIKNYTIFKKFIIDQNWEGIVFANLDSTYEIGLSDNFLKWKREFETEVWVVGYTKGKGKYTGKVGALEVQVKWCETVTEITGGESIHIGQKYTFEVSGGLTDEDRNNIFKNYRIHKMIRIKFNSLSSYGIPQIPRIVKE